MRFKKVFIFIILFVIIFSSISFASVTSVTSEIDVSQIANNFNTSKFIPTLANLGLSIHAVQNGNSIVLSCNNSESITYSYDDSTGILSTSYPDYSSSNYEFLNAIFIDTISKMQGNIEGDMILFALTDAFCYGTLSDSGITKEYAYSENDNSTIMVNFKINPFVKFATPVINSGISESTFRLFADSFYSDDSCLVKDEGLIFYKVVNSDGLLELYIGQPKELSSHSYDSVLTALSILFEKYDNGDKINSYFKQNYSGFDSGNADFDGVSILTNIDGLPISTADTILVGNDMKYAKISINRDIVKEKLPNVQVSVPSSNDSVHLKKNTALIFIVIIVILCIVGYILFKKYHEE